MKKVAFSFPLLLAALLFASPAGAGDSAFWGTGMGAALGGYLGSTIGKGDGRLAATGAGVFLGGLVGNSIGSSMDRVETFSSSRGYGYSPYAPTYYSPYEPNYVAPPSLPPPRVVYVEPEIVEYRRVQEPVYVEEGYLGPPPGQRKKHCREFTQTIKIDGKAHESYGTACLRPDGTWQIESQE